jgi:hypothetical protein
MMAVIGHEFAGGVDLEGAVAGEPLALRGLDDEKGAGIERDIKRIAGARHRAGREIGEGGAILRVGEAAVGAREILLPRDRHHEFLEDHFLGLEAGGRHVRHVVGDDIELATQRDLP